MQDGGLPVLSLMDNHVAQKLPLSAEAIVHQSW
jgi:hypothetical protein